MKSLFEKEEKQTEFNQIKVDLISRFYPFSKEQVIKYKSVLNCGRYHLMNNELVQWDMELIDILDEKIDWSAIYKLKNIDLDISFLKNYKEKINFTSIHLSKNILWSDELLSEFGDRFDWSKLPITKDPLSTIENLRRYKDKLNWSLVSQRINIQFNEAILEEFSDKWDWEKLSANKNLPLSVEFLQKHLDKLDFDAISQNPNCIELIYRYPTSERWNWDKVIRNPAIAYDKESFDFVFSNYKRQYETKEFTNPILKKMALPSFLFCVLTFQQNDINYFLKDDFVVYFPWDKFCKYCNTKLSLDFIEKHKDRLNFKESEFIRMQRDIISTEFIEANADLFHPEHYSFYNLPLTIELLNKFNGNINWNNLSRCEKLDWTWEYVDTNFDKFNLYGLAENKGIFEKLIKEKLSEKEILELLDNSWSKT